MRNQNKEYILSLSYGKDSLACLGAIEKLGLPLDRIVHAEVWATDTISADLPPMQEFKAKADRIIKERWGINVEHIVATKVDGYTSDKMTYEKCFFSKRIKGKYVGKVKGFPLIKGNWCNKLKLNAINSIKCTDGKERYDYIGIAADEPNRFHSLNDCKISPLVLANWTEADCRKWCEENDLLSPIYTTATRGGCWFCHNQGIQQLRLLRKNYPDLWQLLLKWDSDSPVHFKPDGHSVHDFDKRFALEDSGVIDSSNRFYWNILKEKEHWAQISLFE